MPNAIAIFLNAPDSLWPFLFSDASCGFILAGQIPWNDIFIVGIGVLTITFALIGIFIFKGYWKRHVSEKIRSNREYGMNLQDLEKMKDTGLLSEEEHAKIKERQLAKIREEIERDKQLTAEQKKAQKEPRKKSVSTQGLLDGMDPKLAAALAREGASVRPQSASQNVEDQLRAQIAEQGGELPPEQSPPSQTATSAAERKSGQGRTPIDVEDLLERGLITPQEYEKIKNALNK